MLSLGLSKQLTSLVWLAGPLSGLVAQPVSESILYLPHMKRHELTIPSTSPVGALSDASTTRFRRRYFIIVATILIGLSMLLLAFAREIAAGGVAVWATVGWVGGGGDWDPAESRQVRLFQLFLLHFDLKLVADCSYGTGVLHGTGTSSSGFLCA